MERTTHLHKLLRSNRLWKFTLFVRIIVKKFMTLRQRYKSLNDPHSVMEMVVTSVYNTMQMEGQPVPKDRIERLYNQVKEERGAEKESSLQTS